MARKARSSSSFPEAFYEAVANIFLRLVYFGFAVYSFILTILFTLFFPLTKYLVDNKLQSFGIITNGSNPWDIKVLNEKRFYLRMAIERSYGLLECLLNKDCETKDLKGIVDRVWGTRRQKEVMHPLTWIFSVFNMQTPAKAWEVAEMHYDAGDDIIKAMLDKNLQYTCGYWKDAQGLDEAQIAKMDLIAKKLRLKPGMRVLDIGSGYGTLAIHLARNYGVSVVGVNVSRKQNEFAEQLGSGLPCEFRLCDYRDIESHERFDRIVSVGMFEHVGRKNYKKFFQLCKGWLAEDGIFVLQTIGNCHKKLVTRDSWVHQYVFRNGMIPYYLEVCKAIEDLWVIEDLQSMGNDYCTTLVEWERRFDKAWPKFQNTYGSRFHTVWKMYLQVAQALFANRSLQLWQIVLSKDGLRGGYHAPR